MAQKVRHVVLMKFKDGTTPAQLNAIQDEFATLYEKIDEIVDFEWGNDISVEGLSRGFTHCFLVTFKSAVGRDAYLPHPAHKAFVGVAGPQIDEVLVLDYAVR
ncbi:MAG: Dabb family protein [Candidatus Poribacteria bacterium]|nr:Dabb family protein [Candidatus Poribacteria bacterium]